MASFKTRIKKLSSDKSPLILANDYESGITDIESRTVKNIKTLSPYLCAIKFNFHLLLPLGQKQISKINKLAHDHNLQTIADIKLNDIGNTNNVTAETLWGMGFDSVIVNPMMGPGNLEKIISHAHKNDNGVISLCHMSSPEAQLTYELQVQLKSKKTILYHLFLEWATSLGADGIIVGATFPEIVQFCKKKSKGKINIYSPGIGTQGGDIQKTIQSGSDYLIVGRTILNSKNPRETAKSLFDLAKH
ncbi:MAG: orotidine 5'-phosphate decarboxylase [Candidatus Aenigmarchaeota archaeon]|nr:orotidine 5'-phosphate decarboxylase [Candidatus Aenigmarchaeota archaeon]